MIWFALWPVAGWCSMTWFLWKHPTDVTVYDIIMSAVIGVVLGPIAFIFSAWTIMRINGVLDRRVFIKRDKTT